MERPVQVWRSKGVRDWNNAGLECSVGVEYQCGGNIYLMYGAEAVKCTREHLANIRIYKNKSDNC